METVCRIAGLNPDGARSRNRLLQLRGVISESLRDRSGVTVARRFRAALAVPYNSQTFYFPGVHLECLH